MFICRLVYENLTKFPGPVIVLEDVSPEGFTVFEAGLNLVQVKTVAKRIAQFHAASVYLNENVRFKSKNF